MRSPLSMSLAITVLAFATATTAFAQDDILAVDTSNGAIRTDVGALGKSVRDKKFWLLAAALNTTMILDTKSTFDVVRQCLDCREANPFVAPFLRRGQVVTYGAGTLFDAGVMTVAAKMKGSSRTWMRRTWWVAPAALVVGHSIAQRHNVNLLKE